MRKTYVLAAIFILAAIAVLVLLRGRVSDNGNSSQPVLTGTQGSAESQSQDWSSSQAGSGSGEPPGSSVPGRFAAPISRAGERVTKKPFGIFIAPQNSPVSPEKFRGYHTGSDFEIFPEELNQDVQVSAVCDGTLKVKEYASGYGGVAVEACDLNGSPIMVIYGHLKLASITANVGESLKAGDRLGILGAAYSSETDGERKHLHLGFHKGSAVNILGYVQSRSELSNWIDPCLYACK
ncbi:MAG: M23 family metallopeptidase [Candidatus Moranbacteria bacterium]|nr:M23 family metallopeptidase [Candidatus Moranbacteria bacterium]